MLSIYRAGEIDLFENLDIVHIRLLVDSCACEVATPNIRRCRDQIGTTPGLKVNYTG